MYTNSIYILQLFSEGIRYSTKSEAERIKYGRKLENELMKFQQHFLPHMQEEEDIFQPLLVQYFSVEELKELKESVLKVIILLPPDRIVDCKWLRTVGSSLLIAASLDRLADMLSNVKPRRPTRGGSFCLLYGPTDKLCSNGSAFAHLKIDCNFLGKLIYLTKCTYSHIYQSES